jgi:hypothetical protein
MTKETAQHYRALAAKYRTFGFNLVPLGSDKRPVVTGINPSGGLNHFRWQDWQATPQTDARWKELKAFAWWIDVAGLAALSGPVSGDLVCIDFDRAEWAIVETFLTAANLSAAWTVTTPGGGWHVWVRCPGLELDKGKLDRAAVDGAGHIELRHTGHYTALPGSMHPNGRCYAWHGDAPVDAPPIVAPDALLAAYDAVTTVTAPVVSVPISGDMPTGTANIAPAYAQKALDEEVQRLRTAADGTRNDTANKTAFALGQLVGAGALGESEVEAALLNAATSAGLTEGEALASIRSGLRAGVKLPRQIPVNGNGYTNGSGSSYEYGFVVDVPEPLQFKAGKANPTDEAEPGQRMSEKIDFDLAAWGYAFTLCELDDTIEVNRQRLDDKLAAQIRMNARDAGYGGRYGTPLTAIEDQMRVLAARNAYHPVRRYLESLEWDGNDHFSMLAAHISDKHSPIVYEDGTREPVVKVFLWRWMVGAVAKVYASGVIRAQNPMLVLSGQQNMGKSTLAAWLCALPEMFIESSINPDSADHLRYLVTKWIWEVGELGATTRRSDREALKAFLTKQEATFRKPYDHHPVIKPALASFIGTVNPMNTGFLDDPTGSRRFITAELVGIDHSYAQKIEVDQLWAQIYAAYRRDPQGWRLTPAEQQKRDVINGENEVERPYEGLVSRLFECDPTQGEWWMATSEIVDILRTYGETLFDETRHHGILGATLKGLGLERRQKQQAGERIWGYAGIKSRIKPANLPEPPPER